jgi:hypothetical protein
MAIQPYWLLVAEFFFFEITTRIWDRVNYGTWLLPSEYVADEIIQDKKSPRRPHSTV